MKRKKEYRRPYKVWHYKDAPECMRLHDDDADLVIEIPPGEYAPPTIFESAIFLDYPHPFYKGWIVRILCHA